MPRLLKSALSAVAGLVLTLGFAMPVATHAEVLLTVETGPTEVKSYTREDLEAMPRVSFRTGTTWTEGAQEFSGVPLKSILAASGITSGLVRAVAVNDYIVDIPVDELDDSFPIIADLIDGKPFSRREKGPLWIMYPFDKAPSYRTETNFGRSVWQLVRLTQAPPSDDASAP